MSNKSEDGKIYETYSITGAFISYELNKQVRFLPYVKK